MYSNTAANETSNVLSLLKYTNEYSDRVGQDQFFYVDSSNGTPEPQVAQPLYNEGFAKRKTLTDGGAVKGTVSRILAKFRHRKWSSNSVKY